MFGVIDDSPYELRILHEEIPIKGKVAFAPISMRSFVLGRLSMPDEE